MAGSYNHVTTESGALRRESFADLIDNLGDAFEAVEELYGMVWFLADGDPDAIERARQGYQQGLTLARLVVGEEA